MRSKDKHAWEVHAGRWLTKHQANEKWSYGKTLLAQVDAGTFDTVKRDGVTFKLKPVQYQVIEEPPGHSSREPSGSPRCYKAEAINEDISIHRSYDMWRSTISGALRVLQHRVLESFNDDWILSRSHDKKMGRGEVAKILKMAVTLMWHGFNEPTRIYHEVGIYPGVADVMALFIGGDIRIAEIKSCRADFTSDKKWRKYLPHCTRMMFVALPGVIKPKELPPEIGLYTLNMDWPKNEGLILTARKHPAQTKMKDIDRMYLYQKLIFWAEFDDARWWQPSKYYQAQLAEQIRRLQIHGVR